LREAIAATQAAAEEAVRGVHLLQEDRERNISPTKEFDGYVGVPPNSQTTLDLFAGEWSSRLPFPLASLHAGDIPLFEDARITWALDVLGPVEGRDVLELGPLECGHTYMLDRAGAREVLAIEGNRRAYLRCLVVKELLDIRSARLLLGDFVEFLAQQPAEADLFDLAVASGVLYHMEDPLRLLELLAARARRILLWTHYYDEEVIRSRPELDAKFPGTTSRAWRGRTFTYHRLEYAAAVRLPGFCGGPAARSNWLSREELLLALDILDLDVLDVAFEQDDRANGPAFAVAACRRG